MTTDLGRLFSPKKWPSSASAPPPIMQPLIKTKSNENYLKSPYLFMYQVDEYPVKSSQTARVLLPKGLGGEA